LANEETQYQADFSKDFDMGLFSPMTVAFGISYLDETYEISASSDVDSYRAGPFSGADPFGFCNADGTATAAGDAVIANGSSLDCANGDDPVFTVVGVGSNGFPGYDPNFLSGDYERDSTAVYVDLSADVTEDLFLQGAVRYEDYSDFGNETVGKVAARYRLSDKFAIRVTCHFSITQNKSLKPWERTAQERSESPANTEHVTVPHSVSSFVRLKCPNTPHTVVPSAARTP
jgi:iron complex outermembrane receptor protein